ncbi:hypothetical protein E2986_12651 [Frieseomelitta varia]|uniref:Uncharacterized protein n=1 Tax=Frieseomelitta varia TaxID=561572 RepID=A0A833S0A8_9HYME|nr:hypothetical protein E2986_12651 [Frieseomelitta varia]
MCVLYQIHLITLWKSFVKTSKEGLGLSDLAKIEEVVDHPVELFRIWHDDARRFNPRAPVACCLATTSKLVLIIYCRETFEIPFNVIQKIQPQ